MVSRFVSFIDPDGIPILLPSLFSLTTNRTGTVLRSKKIGGDGIRSKIEQVYIKSDLSSDGANLYEDQILMFLNYYVNLTESTPGMPGVHMHTHAPTELLNDYINNYLIGQQEKSIEVAANAKVALTAYYDYLADVGITTTRNIIIFPNMKSQARKNRRRKRAYKYIARQTRNQLLLETKTLRDELVLEFGYKCGLRTHELMSLFINDFSYGRKMQNGLLTLFDELDKSTVQEFEYLLTRTKARKNEGSPSRIIYIPRGVLQKCRKYYLDDRGDYSANELFLNDDPANKGQPCAGNIGTRIFRETKERILKAMEAGETTEVPLQEDNTYHHLRHSFATEKFHELCGKTPHHAITEGNSIVTEIARLLGHKINNSDDAQRITSDYIRSVDIMLTIEGWRNGK